MVRSSELHSDDNAASLAAEGLDASLRAQVVYCKLRYRTRHACRRSFFFFFDSDQRR